MRRAVSAILILLCIFTMVAPARCDTFAKKFVRGVSNVLTAPLELPHRINKSYEKGGFVEAAGYGFIEGIAMVGFRAGVGIYEMATFFIPLPPNNEPIIKDPEFFCADFAK